jgi:hypothetical protein
MQSPPRFTAEAAISSPERHFRMRSSDRDYNGVTMALFCDIQAGWHYCEVGGKLVCTPPGVLCTHPGGSNGPHCGYVWTCT